MYVLFKLNRPAGNVKFATYEAARQALRKRLRKLTSARINRQPDSVLGHLFGYEIRKVG